MLAKIASEIHRKNIGNWQQKTRLFSQTGRSLSDLLLQLVEHLGGKELRQADVQAIA